MARRYLRLNEHVNVVGHDNVGIQIIVPKFHPLMNRVDYDFRDGGLTEVQRTRPERVQMPVHPGKSLDGGEFSRRRRHG